MKTLLTILAICVVGGVAYFAKERSKNQPLKPMIVADPEDMRDRREVFFRVSCDHCHSLDGTHLIGPTMKGLYGSQVTLSDGSVVTADEPFIRNFIVSPNNKIIKGYSPTMPSFNHLLSDKDVDDLVAFIKKQK